MVSHVAKISITGVMLACFVGVAIDGKDLPEREPGVRIVLVGPMSKGLPKVPLMCKITPSGALRDSGGLQIRDGDVDTFFQAKEDVSAPDSVWLELVDESKTSAKTLIGVLGRLVRSAKGRASVSIYVHSRQIKAE